MQHKAKEIRALPLEHNPGCIPSWDGESLGYSVPLSLNLLHGLRNLYPSPAQAKCSIKQHIRISEEIWGECKEPGSSQLEDKVPYSARPYLQPLFTVVHCGFHLVLSARNFPKHWTNAPHSGLPLSERSLAWDGLFSAYHNPPHPEDMAWAPSPPWSLNPFLWTRGTKGLQYPLASWHLLYCDLTFRICVVFLQLH